LILFELYCHKSNTTYWGWLVMEVDMDIMVDYHDSTSLAQELKLIQFWFWGSSVLRARSVDTVLDSFRALLSQIEHDILRLIGNSGRYGYHGRLPSFDLGCPETKIDPIFLNDLLSRWITFIEVEYFLSRWIPFHRGGLLWSSIRLVQYVWFSIVKRDWYRYRDISPEVDWWRNYGSRWWEGEPLVERKKMGSRNCTAGIKRGDDGGRENVAVSCSISVGLYVTWASFVWARTWSKFRWENLQVRVWQQV